MIIGESNGYSVETPKLFCLRVTNKSTNQAVDFFAELLNKSSITQNPPKTHIGWCVAVQPLHDTNGARVAPEEQPKFIGPLLTILKSKGFDCSISAFYPQEHRVVPEGSVAEVGFDLNVYHLAQQSPAGIELGKYIANNSLSLEQLCDIWAVAKEKTITDNYQMLEEWRKQNGL